MLKLLNMFKYYNYRGKGWKRIMILIALLCAISIFHLNNPPPPTLDVEMNAASRSRQPFFQTGPQVVTSSRAATCSNLQPQFTPIHHFQMRKEGILTMIAKLHAPTEARSVQAWHLARPIHSTRHQFSDFSHGEPGQRHPYKETYQ